MSPTTRPTFSPSESPTPQPTTSPTPCTFFPVQEISFFKNDFIWVPTRQPTFSPTSRNQFHHNFPFSFHLIWVPTPSPSTRPTLQPTFTPTRKPTTPEPTTADPTSAPTDEALFQEFMPLATGESSTIYFKTTLILVRSMLQEWYRTRLGSFASGLILGLVVSMLR